MIWSNSNRYQLAQKPCLGFKFLQTSQLNAFKVLSKKAGSA